MFTIVARARKLDRPSRGGILMENSSAGMALMAVQSDLHAASEDRVIAQFLLDAQELVVFRDPVGAAQWSRS